MNGAREWIVPSAYVLACIAAIWGVVHYPGDKLIFCFFSFVIFGIGYVALRFSWQYAHLFLSFAWFMGFWFKYIYHLVTGAPYYELYGSFDNANASWDAVFFVIGIGGAGYIAGRLISLQLIRKFIGPLAGPLRKRAIFIPTWWASYRTVVWLVAALLVLSCVIANQELGILTRGYVANLILPWPLGGLYAWMTDIGLALLLSLLLAWDRQSGFGIARGFAALCVEGALFSISTLSRGIYFFHTLPPLVTESADAARGASRRPLAVLFSIWVLIGVAVPSASTFLRLFGVNAVPTTQAQLTASQSLNISRPMLAHQTAGGLWNQFETMVRLLLIDRWTGLEGMMATVAYPDKSLALFAEAATFRRSYGTVDVYTRKISGSTFTEENAKKYHFATLAGPIAFLYFSGSRMVVFIGMALIAMVMSAAEWLWLRLARDRLLVAMSGFYLALVVLQLSGGLVQAATGPLAVTGALAAIWLMGRIQERGYVGSEMAPPQEFVVLAALKSVFASSDLLAFNLLNRDRWIAEQAAAVPAGSKVLDVGAGSAPYRALFAHCDYKTQDFAQLKDAQLRYGGYAPIDFVSEANAIPVPDASFDVVICTEVIEHVAEPITVVREFGRIVAPGGRLILTAPLGSGIHQEPYHFYGGYTPYWYERFLRQAGFGSIVVTANAGTLRHTAQETIRFARMTRPFAFPAPWYGQLLWLPFWLILAPVLALGVPLAAKLLDRFDREQRFTVGYHVTAVRANAV